MSSTAIADLVEMLEALPSTLQERVVDRLREYIADLRDEQRWDASFTRTQSALVAAAQQAKKEWAAGKASEMDYEQL